MPRVEFPAGVLGVEDLPRTRRSLQNCFNNLEGKIISRPGIAQLNTTGSVARGQFVWNGDLYQVVSQELIKITNTTTGAFDVIGTIAGNAVIETDVGFNEAVIVVKAVEGDIYSLSNSTVFISISSVSDSGGIAQFNPSGAPPSIGSTVTIKGFITNTAYNVTGIVTAVGGIAPSVSITTVGGDTGVAQFNHDDGIFSVGTAVTISGYVTNTDYNVIANITKSIEAIENTSISSVSDSGGTASFNHAGTSPSLGSEVTMTGFVTNTAYNTTGVVTASTGTSFEIFGIAFGTDETVGSYTAFGGLQISTVAFGTDESGGSFIPSVGFEIASVSFGTDETTGSYTSVLELISGNSNFVASTDVAFINGRFVYIPFDGDPAFFSDVGNAGSVQPLSFFDAEELPDLNNSVFNFRNTLYIGGTDSFELFRDTGASPNPFFRVSGARVINGYIGGLIEYTNTFLFIGREKDQDFGIYAIGQGVAPKISNEAIDLILSTYDQDELAAAIGGRLKWRGYDIATFTLARDSFAFFGGNWFILDTVFDGISKPWGGGFITQFDGEYYTAFSDKIGKFEKVNTDYGERITRIIDTGFEHPDDDFFTAQSIELGISQGCSSTDGTVALFMSRNNVTYGEPFYRSLGDIGQYTKHLIWNFPGGMGTYDGFMGTRIYTNEDVEFSADHLIVNFR